MNPLKEVGKYRVTRTGELLWEGMVLTGTGLLVENAIKTR